MTTTYTARADLVDRHNTAHAATIFVRATSEAAAKDQCRRACIGLRSACPEFVYEHKPEIVTHPTHTPMFRSSRAKDD